MANQILLIGNPTSTAYSNVNAAGDDILPYALGSTQTNASGLVTLTDAEQATFAAAHPEALMVLFSSVAPSDIYQTKRNLARMLKYRGAASTGAAL